MKQTVDFYQFRKAFQDAGRGEQFTSQGLVELFDYLEMLESTIEQEIELDVIALCCEYAEYSSALDAIDGYNHDAEITKTIWIAGTNMPGYMPDSDPIEFDDEYDAHDYIASLMKGVADDIEDENQEGADDLRESAFDLKNCVTGEYGRTIAGGHYWVTSQTVPHEDAEQNAMEWLSSQTMVVAFNGGVIVQEF
jgi:hypothetical protein